MIVSMTFIVLAWSVQWSVQTYKDFGYDVFNTGDCDNYDDGDDADDDNYNRFYGYGDDNNHCYPWRWSLITKDKANGFCIGSNVLLTAVILFHVAEITHMRKNPNQMAAHYGDNAHRV
jgi:hypothetical protein